MLTSDEICEQAKININTFKSWRRDHWRLLPGPVGVSKKVLLFDDSICERIEFIKRQRAAGKKLKEIEKLIVQQDLANYCADPFHNPNEDDYREMDFLEHELLTENRKNEICLALKLDPALSGLPVIFIKPLAIHERHKHIIFFVSIISNNYIHFAELWLRAFDLSYKAKRHEKMLVEYYGMFIGQITQIFADNGQIISSVEIPCLLIESLNNCREPGREAVVDCFKNVEKLTKILKHGQEFARGINM